MVFNIILFEGTDKIRLNTKRDEIMKTYSQFYERRFKRGKAEADSFSYFHVLYDDNGLSEAIEFFDPSEINFNGHQLINERYDKVEKIFSALDSNLEYEQGVGFVSLKYQIGVYAPYGKVESFLVGREGYYNQ
jgi:hypothetical protein